MVVRGAGHEIRTTTGGLVAEIEVGRVDAGFDASRRLCQLVSSPAAPWASVLVGQRSGGGFRRALAQCAPPDSEGSLVRQLLDDLPAALLISGYSAMRRARRNGVDPALMVPPDVLPRMTDLCSGWRAGGVGVENIALGLGVPVQNCPPSTDLEVADPVVWHSIPDLRDNWMRRRRCIDVAPRQGGAEIWAMFRDTVAERDGDEIVLHEYSVSLSVDVAADRIPLITSATAEPAVLPFPECPAAAAVVGSVAGLPLGELPRAVPETLQGVQSCTHLNDLLRSIGGSAPAMMAAALRL